MTCRGCGTRGVQLDDGLCSPCATRRSEVSRAFYEEPAAPVVQMLKARPFAPSGRVHTIHVVAPFIVVGRLMFWWRALAIGEGLFILWEVVQFPEGRLESLAWLILQSAVIYCALKFGSSPKSPVPLDYLLLVLPVGLLAFFVGGALVDTLQSANQVTKGERYDLLRLIYRAGELGIVLWLPAALKRERTTRRAWRSRFGSSRRPDSGPAIQKGVASFAGVGLRDRSRDGARTDRIVGYVIHGVGRLLCETIIGLPLGLPIGAYGRSLIARAEQRLAPTALEVLSADSRPPVLWLRSFRDDGNAIEEVLAASLKRWGPVIAIGDPREEAPPLGAARGYVDDRRQWQHVFAQIAERAQVILLMLGTGRGVLWETQTVLELGLWDRCIVIVPQASVATLQRRWAQFRQAVPTSLPADTFDARRSLFVLFTPEGDCVNIVGKRRNDSAYLAGLAVALAILADTE